MAKHANLTTQTTVLSRDFLPTDGYIIPVNKPPPRPAKSCPNARVKIEPISGRQPNDVRKGTPLPTHDSQ